jgi:hypothetical protein
MKEREYYQKFREQEHNGAILKAGVHPIAEAADIFVRSEQNKFVTVEDAMFVVNAYIYGHEMYSANWKFLEAKGHELDERPYGPRRK